MVPIEVVVTSHETFNARELDHYIFELSGEEEARGHALAARDCVSFGSTGTYDLEQLLSNSDVLT